MRNLFLVAILLTLITAGILYRVTLPKTKNLSTIIEKVLPTPLPTDPLQITQMRAQHYPGSPITIEETLHEGSNYKSYVASYRSDGLKIYALLTVPKGEKPKNGWPIIVFNHGYIPANVYQTTVRYEAYVDAFARSGYVVFKPDYRGNGKSEGNPEGAYYSPAYTVDDLNAIASIMKFKDVNPKKVGVWGHSMGGNIALRDIVIWPDTISAVVIWGGVVGSYEDMTVWHDPFYQPSEKEQMVRSRKRGEYIKKYGTPKSNSSFWQSIDPTYFISDIKTPIQLHASLTDEEVPASFSANLENKLKQNGKVVQAYFYPNDDHNISLHFSQAMQKSVEFFDTYLKEK